MTVPNTSTNRYACSNIIVAPTIAEGAMFTTIGAALTYAIDKGLKNILVKPGIYTENLSIDFPVNISGMPGTFGQVKLVGKITIDGATNCSLSNFTHETNSDYLIDITGTGINQSTFTNIHYTVNSTGIHSSNSSGSPSFRDCFFSQQTDSVGFFNFATASQPTFTGCIFTNDSGGNPGTSTIASGTCYAKNCFFGPQLFTTSGSGSYNWSSCQRSTNVNSVALTTSGTGTTELQNCYLSSGTSAAISIGTGTAVRARGLTIDSTNTNPITGAGTFTSSPVIFSSTGNGINVTTTTLNQMNMGGLAYLGNTILTPQTNGQITYPLQTTFGMTSTSAQTNQTGDGTVATVTFDNSLFNIGSSFNTGTYTFTAPVTAKYMFNAQVFATGIGTHTDGYIQILSSSGRALASTRGNPTNMKNASNQIIYSASGIITATAADTFTVQFIMSGSTKTVGYSNNFTYFAGWMLG